MTVGTALNEASRALGTAGIEGPRLDAEILMAHCLGRDRSWLAGHGDALLDAVVRERFCGFVEARRGGTPVAYLTGEKEFYGLSFAVTPDVLIPRPETEGLVDRAAALARGAGARRLVDVGTGSGCIAVAALRAAGFEDVAAVDVCDAALAVARANAARHGADVTFARGDLLAPLRGTPFEGRTDVVVSNPPYVSERDMGVLPPEVRHEPARALAGGPDGLALVERLATEAASFLAPGGFLLVEIGEEQGAGARAAARRAGFAAVRVEADLAGLPRYLVAQRGPGRGGNGETERGGP